MKLVFIAGLSHSGTTLLEMLLSCHSAIVGLGEADFLIHRAKRNRHVPYAHDRICSCLKTLDQCPVWSQHLRRLTASPGEAYDTLYADVLKHVKACSGSEIVSDSSKHLSALKRVIASLETIGIPDHRFMILQIVRDVRGYVFSHARRYGGGPAKIHSYFRSWRRMNQRLANFIAQTPYSSLQLGYEELCFYTRASMERCSAFLGLEFSDRMLDIRNAEGHIGVANPMSYDSQKASGIFYDHRWFLDFRVNLFYLLFPRIRALNRSTVYGNWSQESHEARLYTPPA